MICKIVKSFVLWQKIQPTTGLTWMTFYESWVFRFRCSRGTNEKRLYSTDTVVRAVFFKASNSEENCKTVNWRSNVLFNTDQRFWIFKTSLAFQLNDVSLFCRLFFCSQVCHPVQWCSVILIQLFLCSQVWSKVSNSFAHLVQHRTTKSVQDCRIMLSEFGRGIKFANEKSKEREPTKWGRSWG